MSDPWNEERPTVYEAGDYIFALEKKLEAAEARVAATEREVLERIVERGDLRLLGLPLDDLNDIYALVSDWRRMGGRQQVLDSYREKVELEARVAALTQENEERENAAYEQGYADGWQAAMVQEHPPEDLFEE